MRKLVCILGVWMACAAAVNADYVAFWNFNDTTNVGTNLWRINPLGTVGNEAEYTRDIGLGGARISVWGSGGGNLAGTNGGTESQNFGSYTGTTLNDISGTPTAGGSLSILGTDNNDRSFVIKLDDPIDNCVLTYATRGTSTGFGIHQFAYSTDGGLTWQEYGTLDANKTSSWLVFTKDFGSVFAATSGPNTNLIRITVSGAASHNGNNRFDNILVSGTIVPEPAGLLLLALGAGLLRRR